MTQIILLILLVFSVESKLFLKNTESAFDQCIFEKDEFWLLYETHFLLSNTLSVRVLQTKDHKFEVDRFTQRGLKKMNSFGYRITTDIQEIFLSENYSSRNQYITPCPRISTDWRYPDTDIQEELFRIKMSNSDSIKGYAIIVWDAEKLHRFLNENYEKVIPEARATYALAFVSSPTEDELNSILRRFWIEYHVVNIIAQVPCSCDSTQIYIYRPFIKIGDSWGLMDRYSIGEVINNFKLIINPLDNFNDFPLKVSVFENPPFTLGNLPKCLQNSPIYKNLNSSKGFAGVDGLLLGTLVEYFKFNAILMGNEEKDPFGAALPNGTITGSLGDVVHRKVTFSANGRFMADYLTREIEFTASYNSDRACIMAPKAPKIPKWKTIFYAFDDVTWCFIGVTYVTCVMTWYIIGPSKSISRVVWEMYLYVMGVPVKMSPTPSQFVFLVSCMLFSIKILGVLQGSLFNAFTLTTYYKDINTLKEVDESGMPIASNIWSLVSDESDLMKSLKKRGVDVYENTSDLVAYGRKLMYFDTRAYLEILKTTKYIDENGLPLLHIVEECVTTFLVSNILPRGSAFLTIFNNVITRLFESGLTKKWFYDVIDAMEAEKMFGLGAKEKAARSFSVHDVQSAFLVLVLGYVISVVVFLGEVLYK